MKVLCESRLTIDFQLWNTINRINVPNDVLDTVITFPVARYEYPRWIRIFRALLPAIPFPFNAPYRISVKDLLNEIDSCIRYLTNDDATSIDLSEAIPYGAISYEDWYETAIYAYQNLLLTSSSKKRELIDAEFQEANSKAKYKIDRNRAHEERTRAINNLKQSTYDWVNRIGHIAKEYKYMWLHQQCDLNDINEYVAYADLMMVNGVLNNSFTDTSLVDPKYAHLLTYRKSYPHSDYAEAIQYYTAKECTSDTPSKERSIYNTIISLIVLYYNYHHAIQMGGLLHEFDIMSIVEDYLNDNATTLTMRIRTLTNRLTDSNFNAIHKELQLYDRNIVVSVLAKNIHGEPQQECIIRLIKEFDMTDTVISELKKHVAKKYESYHNTVAWSMLYGIIPITVMNDPEIFTPQSSVDILIAILAHSNINRKFIIDNYKDIRSKLDALLVNLKGYAKYKAIDAINEAESIMNSI